MRSSSSRRWKTPNQNPGGSTCQPKRQLPRERKIPIPHQPPPLELVVGLITLHRKKTLDYGNQRPYSPRGDIGNKLHNYYSPRICLYDCTPFCLDSSKESLLLLETGNDHHLTWSRDKRTAYPQSVYLVSLQAPSSLSEKSCFLCVECPADTTSLSWVEHYQKWKSTLFLPLRYEKHLRSHDGKSSECLFSKSSGSIWRQHGKLWFLL